MFKNCAGKAARFFVHGPAMWCHSRFDKVLLLWGTKFYVLASWGLKFQVHSAAWADLCGAWLEEVWLHPWDLKRQEFIQVHGVQGTTSPLLCKRQPSLSCPGEAIIRGPEE